MGASEEQTDEELVALSLLQKESFGLIIKRYQERLARYVRRLGVQGTDDIQDILQEIFIKVYINLREYDSTLKFSSWVYRIAHNETISWFRKRNVRPEGNLVFDSESILMFTESTEWGNEQLFDATINSEVLHKALLELGDTYREIVILRFFEHKEYEEISDILKIPIGTVGTLLHRAKKQIKKLIDTKKIFI